MTSLVQEIAACRVCAKFLPADAHPVVQFSDTARILIIGQAPGSKVNATGIPWNDASGDRLREWTGLRRDDFYNPAKVALVPMGFCYPGKGKSGDLPPRPECAPLWHPRILKQLPEDRLELLVGSYAQPYYLPDTRKQSLTERVQNWRCYLPDCLPLPHPSWRSTIWMKKNPWFETDVLPELRKAVAIRL